MSRSNDAQFLNQRAKTADAAGAAGIADVAITRRGFVVGAALAGAALMFGLPEGVSPFGVQKAHAAVLSSGELDNYNIRLRPRASCAPSACTTTVR